MVNNDVFLSYRGEFTRKTLLSHLLSSFKKNSITTFSASDSSHVFLETLEKSLVAIPVISKDHASLEFWVNDLAKIIEYEKKGTLTAVPIFFQLDSHDILIMLRSAGKKSQSLQGARRKTHETVKKWLDGHVINKSGFHSSDCKDDAELVQKVTCFVSDVLTSSRFQTSGRLSPARSFKLADAFRLDPIMNKDDTLLCRLRDNTTTWKNSCLKDLREVFSSNSSISGVSGIEGLGKTSLVKQVYDEFSPQFQFHFFMFRPEVKSYRQNSLISDLDDIEMIGNRKVLLVVDEVADINQVKSIIKDASWFGRGSRTIIITQDRSLLTQCGVKSIYELECPKTEEALGFFSEFAFKTRNPFPGFEDLSLRAVQVSNRLPLALKMLGLFLYDKEKDEWVSTLRKLEALQNNYSTEVCRYVGADDYAPRRPMKVNQLIGGDDEVNRLPFYRFGS